MKFVIKSLLFVNLLLQLTSSLRKCFDHDQNLMLTIILLAFSLIGLIGLTIGNRFILIIFAACMTLMFIASITIYAIGRSEKDSMQPKVPYYINVPQSDHQGDERRSNDPNKLKSLVSKLLNRNQRPPLESPSRGAKRRNNRTRIANANNNNNYYDTGGGQLRRTLATSGSKRTNQLASAMNPSNSSSLLMLVPPAALAEADYTDTEAQSPHLVAAELQLGRSGVGSTTTKNVLTTTELRMNPGDSSSGRQQQEMKSLDGQDQDDGGDLNQVRSEQWIAYERYLYEKYLNIVSQSIDLIMHTILASWMALLLDDEADQCFGSKHSASNKSQLVHGADHNKGAPVYNYNGVRYSIRPDTADDSPARVVVR